MLQSNHKDGGRRRRNKWMLIDEEEGKNCVRQISPETKNKIMRLPLKLSPASSSLSFSLSTLPRYSQRYKRVQVPRLCFKQMRCAYISRYSKPDNAECMHMVTMWAGKYNLRANSIFTVEFQIYLSFSHFRFIHFHTLFYVRHHSISTSANSVAVVQLMLLFNIHWMLSLFNRQNKWSNDRSNIIK